MPFHDFGIMNKPPKAHRRYDSYRPQKYGCISVNDDYIMPLCEELALLKTYWHTLDRAESGLAYYGITLIPPESLDGFIDLIYTNPDLSELTALLIKAKESDSYVIHFGI
ncbi:MAG: hypothetical protein NC340_01715 [Ruminococcus flavefaciens]|nr:hypothetical protein [Ruminococcus flavefaciens]MCM1228864.1 hypothetical protein [Ruminococcus flavefaciens]